MLVIEDSWRSWPLLSIPGNMITLYSEMTLRFRTELADTRNSQ